MKCEKCEWFKESMNILKWNKGELIISGEYAFHMEDTHGFPHELLPDAIRSILLGHLKRIEYLKSMKIGLEEILHVLNSG